MMGIGKKKKQETVVAEPPAVEPPKQIQNPLEWWGIKSADGLSQHNKCRGFYIPCSPEYIPDLYKTKEAAASSARFGQSIVKVRLIIEEEHWK